MLDIQNGGELRFFASVCALVSPYRRKVLIEGKGIAAKTPEQVPRALDDILGLFEFARHPALSPESRAPNDSKLKPRGLAF